MNRQKGVRYERAFATMARPRGLRRTVKLAVILATGVAITSVSPAVPARAECGTPDSWPSFASVAPGAYAVLVGEVERIVSHKRHHPGSFGSPGPGGPQG